MSASGEKVGEPSKALAAQLAAMQAQEEDTSCGYAEEGQDGRELNTESISPTPSTKVAQTVNDDTSV